MIKRMYWMLLLVATVLANSCTSLTDVENRLDKLETEVTDIKKAIAALERAYEDGKLIKSVEPAESANGGWVITFSDGQAIELKNGANGTDGANGEDGKDGVDGTDGKDGKDGVNGKDGEDGITPYLLVDQDGYWCVSYDGGETFTRLMNNAGEYIKATGEKGDKGDKGDDGEQGDKGDEGLSVRVSVDANGYYVFEMYYASAPKKVVETVKTPYQSDPSKVIGSIIQDDQTGIITITMENGTSYTFNIDYATPSSIAILTSKRVVMGKGTTAQVEFRVNPSNARFVYNPSSASCEISLDMVGKTRLASYITEPTNYELTKVERVKNDQGVVTSGQYRAYITDLRKKTDYIEDVALVLTVDNGNGEKVQISSSAFEVCYAGNLISSFSFMKEDNDGVLSDVKATISGNKITVCTPMVTDKSKLVATFTTTGEKVYANGEEQVSGISINDFSSPVKYTVIAADGERKEYEVEVTNTGLPVVVINTVNAATIPPKTADWLEGTYIKIINPDGTVDYEGDEDNIRGRGNSTWSYPKKPYALKLDKKAEILGMPKHKRWVLLANWMDRTMIRNSVAFQISKSTGLEWTPRGEFVEVVLNGKHVGNYYLCEHIKVDEDRVNIVEMEETDTEGDAITGGFLMELDTYFDEVNKFKSAIFNLPYNFKEPDEDVLNSQQFEYMRNYVNTLEEALTDETRFAAREFANYMDLDSYIDWWLVHELAFNGEPNHPKSSYMHKDRLGKLKAGPVWDFDWGTFVPTSTPFRLAESIYYKRLFQDPTFVQRVKERWALLKPAFDEIPAFIESEGARLAKSADLNIKMWPISSRTNGDETLSYEAAIARMKAAYESRVSLVDRAISSL